MEEVIKQVRTIIRDMIECPCVYVGQYVDNGEYTLIYRGRTDENALIGRISVRFDEHYIPNLSWRWLFDGPVRSSKPNGGETWPDFMVRDAEEVLGNAKEGGAILPPFIIIRIWLFGQALES